MFPLSTLLELGQKLSQNSTFAWSFWSFQRIAESKSVNKKQEADLFVEELLIVMTQQPRNDKLKNQGWVAKTSNPDLTSRFFYHVW